MIESGGRVYWTKDGVEVAPPSSVSISLGESFVIAYSTGKVENGFCLMVSQLRDAETNGLIADRFGIRPLKVESSNSPICLYQFGSSSK